MECSFALNPDGKWQCPDCGWVYPLVSDKPPRRNCLRAKAPYPPEEAAWILTEICGHCAKFRPADQTCRCFKCKRKGGFKVIDRLRTGRAGCPGLKW